jgi:hypothetical protein
MDNLPNIIMEPRVPVMLAKLDDILLKKFILCITKDLTPEDKALFADYRLVEYDDQIHRNVPIDQIRWDFLVIDLRQKGDRYTFMKEVQPRRELYNIIVFCHGFEVDDIEIPHDNALSSFPLRQAKREDFEMLLLMARVKKPRWWISLFSCILNFYHRTK